MDITKKFSRDDDKVEDGVWFDLGEARIKVRYFKNEDFLKFVRSQSQGMDDLPDDIQDSVSEKRMAKGLSKYILVNWENVEINGEETEYSQETAEKVLQELPEFTDVVIQKAQKLSAFRNEEKEVDIKN